MVRLNIGKIKNAVPKIRPEFLNTPQYICEPLEKILGCRVTLKIETMNPIRSFKGRGTETILTNLLQDGGLKGTICASAGNLGQALAYSGRCRNIPVTVVASETANPLKISRIKEFGAKVHLVQGDFELARKTAREMALSDNLFLVEDSENLDTCEGAATIGLELLKKSNDLDAVLIALGGGAMATGVGYVFKTLASKVEVIGIQPKGAPAMTLSWRARKVINTETMNTIADGVAGRFPIAEVLEDLLEVADDIVLVREESIKAGMRLLFECAGLVVEPSAALGIAAVLENKTRFSGKHVATIICGSNVMKSDFQKWVFD